MFATGSLYKCKDCKSLYRGGEDYAVSENDNFVETVEHCPTCGSPNHWRIW